MPTWIYHLPPAHDTDAVNFWDEIQTNFNGVFQSIIYRGQYENLWIVQGAFQVYSFNVGTCVAKIIISSSICNREIIYIF